MARHLGAGQDSHRRFRRAEGGTPRLHVDVRQKGSVDAGGTRPHQLDQGDAGQGFGGLLGERSSEAHRGHRACHQKRRRDYGLVCRRVLEERAEHAIVVAKRAVDIDEREQRGRLLDLRAAAKHNRRHLDRVARVFLGDHAAHEGHVRPADVGVDHVEVARLERQILRLDDGATGAVDLRGGLGHLVEVREVLDGGTPTAAVEVGDEGRAIDRRVDHMVATDGHGVLGIARLHLEGRRDLLDLLLDKGRFEVDPVFLDPKPGPPKGVNRLRVKEIDADLLQDQHRVGVDLLHLLLVEDVVGLERVLPHAVMCRRAPGSGPPSDGGRLRRRGHRSSRSSWRRRRAGCRRSASRPRLFRRAAGSPLR